MSILLNLTLVLFYEIFVQTFRKNAVSMYRCEFHCQIPNEDETEVNGEWRVKDNEI